MLFSVSQFVDYLDQKGVKYNYRGPVGDNGSELVDVAFVGRNISSILVHFVFDPDSESVALCVYDIAKVPAEKVDMMYPVINRINWRFRFAKFALDTNDNTIHVEIDGAFCANDVGEICYELLSRMITICESAYPDLMQELWRGTTQPLICR